MLSKTTWGMTAKSSLTATLDMGDRNWPSRMEIPRSWAMRVMSSSVFSDDSSSPLIVEVSPSLFSITSSLPLPKGKGGRRDGNLKERKIILFFYVYALVYIYSVYSLYFMRFSFPFLAYFHFEKKITRFC